MANLDLAQSIEVAQQIFPFRQRACRRLVFLAQQIVEMLLDRQRQERAKDMAAYSGVGGMKDRVLISASD